ncbi:MAG: Uncharacterized protein G01um10147_62 [Microgenomates group bacterium Gr01-1014_7]|nr:MAG: Uncharacterized protein G01um10147_62 [Microgenomates group bacterium Gr01-1014_7]
MRVAIYSPYLDTFGGGEKYMMTIAESLSSLQRVDVLLDKHLRSLGGDYLKKELSKRFDLDLNKVSFIKGPIGEGSSFLARLAFLKHYDVLFYLTDGSIFLSTSKRNILHIQSPLAGQPAKNFWGKLKLKSWNLIIYNSNFTKKHSETNWPLSSEVIYPPVDTDKIKPLKKKKYILSVGRFFGYLKDKKQNLLIKTFRELHKENNLKDWSLQLAGAASKGDESYLRELKNLAAQLPVNFYPNIDYDSLVKLYGESSIYWHASGFSEDDPTKMEHFGITTVEAMAGGCVPVVFNGGGQIEIIGRGTSGMLWDTPEQLKEYTVKLIKNSGLMKKMGKAAIQSARQFSKDKFRDKILKLWK